MNLRKEEEKEEEKKKQLTKEELYLILGKKTKINLKINKEKGTVNIKNKSINLINKEEKNEIKKIFILKDIPNFKEEEEKKEEKETKEKKEKKEEELILNSKYLNLNDFLFSLYNEECYKFLDLSGKLLNDWFDLIRNGYFIDGDSLLNYFLIKSGRNGYYINRDYGCPTLNIVFLIRRFIQKITDHGITARIFFFKEILNTKLKEHEEYNFYRNILMISLRVIHHSHVRCYIFESFESKSFQQLLKYGIKDEFVTCEAIIMDLNFKNSEYYSTILTRQYGIYIIHLPTFTNPVGAASVHEIDKNFAFSSQNEEQKEELNNYLTTNTFVDTTISTLNPLKISYIPFIELFQRLNNLSQSDDLGDIELKSLISTHVICLCIQTLTSVSSRFISCYPKELNNRDSVYKLSDIIQSYKLKYFQLINEYLHELNIITTLTELSMLQFPDSIDMNILSHSEIHISDLWDGRFLYVLQVYCSQYGHQQLFQSLPEHLQNLILTYFQPARDYNWNIRTESIRNNDNNNENNNNENNVNNNNDDKHLAPLIKNDITKSFLQHLDESNNPVINREFSDGITLDGRLYSQIFDASHHFHSNKSLLKSYKLTPIQEERIQLIGEKSIEARRKGSNPQQINRNFDNLPPINWFNWSLIKQEGENPIRTLLSSSNLNIENKYDDIDIGTNLRRNYMLPDNFHMVIHPEPWQLQMLSCLKEKKSLVVVAPTSSGKTMSAEFAMRISANTPENDDGIGVFILPTNALVRQTYATLCNDKYIGKNKIAMFTSERRDNFDSNKYKVLITNPQSLHLLIFSKGHLNGERSLYQRINCVVLDEAHSIGSSGSPDDDDGTSVVIERLLCMLLCPIVCLSATLANANEFLNWLRNIRNTYGVSKLYSKEVTLIEHNERSTALHYHSIAFTSHQKELIEEIDPRGIYEVSKYNYHYKFNIDSPCEMRGEWIITIPEIIQSQMKFQTLITPQVMMGTIKLNYPKLNNNNDSNDSNEDNNNENDNDNDIIIFKFKVVLLPRERNSSISAVLKIEYNGISTNGNIFSIDYNQTNLKIPFRFLFDYNSNEIKFELYDYKFNFLVHSTNFKLNENYHLFHALSTEFIFSMYQKSYQLSNIVATVTSNRRHIDIKAFSNSNGLPDIETIDLNPISFLPNFTSFDHSSFSDFLSASPSLQPHHIIETFDELYHQVHNLDTSSLINLVYLNKYNNVNLIPENLIQVYQKFRCDIFSIGNYEEYAAYRIRYRKYIHELHDIIKLQSSLLHRIILDIMMSKIFNRKNLDWYGKLYFLKPQEINHEIEINWENEINETIQYLIDQMSSNNINPFEICVKQSSNTLSYYSKIYLRNIFAIDSSIKYILSLLLKSGTSDEEETLIPNLLRKSIVNAIQRANQVRTDKLIKTTPTHDDYRLETNKVVSILKYFMENEEIDPSERIVQSPTLLFHFSKQGIERMVNGILDAIDIWYKNRDEGHFLSYNDCKRLNKFLPNQISDIQKRALKYGIGIHSRVSKENQDYLEEVEYLFQSRKLKFVFSTSSLSYGINMPASNVIFLGTSPYLDGLMLRQCAGRAGRRGYGTGIGNVYFAGLSANSIVQKMCMPLNSLKPQLALSTSYLLTSTVSHSVCHRNDCNWIYQLIMRTLTLPLYKFLITSPIRQQPFNQALAHSCLFSWGFLNQRGYLQPDGSPTLKCDLQYRLHYLDPYCFILTELLTECIDSSLSFSKTSLLDMIPKELLLVGNQINLLNQEELNKIKERFDLDLLTLLVYTISVSGTHREKEASNFRLHSVPKQICHDYLNKVIELFVNYLRTNGKNIQETFLPLGSSNQSYDYLNNNENENNNQYFCHFYNWLKERNIQTNLPLSRSCFSGLSGIGDTYENVRDMILSIKDGLFVSEKMIPARDFLDLVQIRFEHVYLKQTFDGLKERYQDVDAKTSCESFSKAIRAVRAFLNQLIIRLKLRYSTNEKDYKILYLYDSIIRVINNFERSLSIAKGLGEKKYGFVVGIGYNDICVDPYGSNIGQYVTISSSREDEYNIGDLVSYYEIMKGGEIYCQFPEKVEDVIVENRNEVRRGVILEINSGYKFIKGIIKDNETMEKFSFYNFQTSKIFNVGDVVNYTTKFIDVLRDLCIDWVE